MLPKKQKGAWHPEEFTPVIQARENMKRISIDYHKRPTMNKMLTFNKAKQVLDEAYLSAEADYISWKISDISHFQIAKCLMLPGKRYIYIKLFIFSLHQESTIYHI